MQPTQRLIHSLRKLASQLDAAEGMPDDPYEELADPLGDFEYGEVAWMLKQAADRIEASERKAQPLL